MAVPGSNPQTTRVMAYLLDITPRRLNQLHDDGVIKPIKRGTWELVDTLHGYIHFLRKGQPVAAGSPDLRAERTRLTKEQADRAAMDNKEKREETLPVAVVKEVWEGIIAAVRARFLALPGRLAVNHPDLVDYATTERLARVLVDEALNELSEFDPEAYHARARARRTKGGA